MSSSPTTAEPDPTAPLPRADPAAPRISPGAATPNSNGNRVVRLHRMVWSWRNGHRPAWLLNVFWSTFLLLTLLVAANVFAWHTAINRLQSLPRARADAHQAATLIGLTRLSLEYAAPAKRDALLHQLSVHQPITLHAQKPYDDVQPLYPGSADAPSAIWQHELDLLLGEPTVLASQINGMPGLWIQMQVQHQHYWLALPPELAKPELANLSSTWALLVATLALVSLAATGWLAAKLNKPLRALLLSLRKLQQGDYHEAELDEHAPTSEVRRVNKGFNQMASRLQRITQDRDLMLAGISHDLRTPLARLRMETELSVTNTQTRQHMNADIDQLDRTIDQFMEFARPKPISTTWINLRELVMACVRSALHAEQFRFRVNVPAQIHLQADPLELIRVLENLFENARRYGKTPGTPVADIDISAQAHPNHVTLRVRDHGPGVPREWLPSLAEPFYRGDSARTAATGAGLGLSIVQRIVTRRGGKLKLTNGSTRGLLVTLELPHEHRPQHDDPPSTSSIPPE